MKRAFEMNYKLFLSFLKSFIEAGESPTSRSPEERSFYAAKI